MKMLRFALVIAAALATAVPAYAAKVVAHIDLSSQRMTVKLNGKPQYTWRVSTGRAGYGTPTGTFRPQRLERSWYSRKYDMAPMPHSIFFHGGYAIHGTTSIRRLGRRASHGCVRLHPSNAAKLYSLVRQHGMGNTRVVITR
jgi:lipoprotein-anchoring transpeptidase ErfK/SrfK